MPYTLTLKTLRWALLLMCFSALGAVGYAQGSATCPPFVETALESVGSACAGLPRNNACYGYTRVSSVFSTEIEESFFSAPSDRAGLQTLVSIQTAPLNEVLEEWGVAVLNVQANVPNTLPGQAVTFILLGDTEITNDVPADEALMPVDPVTVVVTGGARVNLRSGAGTNTNIVGSVAPQTRLLADAQITGGAWLRVVQESGGVAWISRALVAVSPDNVQALADLPVTDGTAFTPMQAFYFTTGLGQPACMSAPNMLVIQGPQETRVDLTANGAQINIGSTVALFSDQTDLGTLLAFGVQEDELSPQGLDDDTPCLHTRMIVLDGDALLNDGATRIPTGHFTQIVTCLEESDDDDDDEDERVRFITRWSEGVRVPQSELTMFEVLENIPADILRYPIRVPTEEDIDRATRPTPTPIPPQATRPPASTATPAGTVDCSAFRATSPQEGATVNPMDVTFFWDPIANVSGYQVDVTVTYSSPSISSGRRLLRVGASQTNVRFSYDDDYDDFINGVTWFVQALTGSEPNLVAVCQTPTRTNPVPNPG